MSKHGANKTLFWLCKRDWNCQERSRNVAPLSRTFLERRSFATSPFCGTLAKQHCIASIKKVQCKTKLEHGIAFVLVLECNESGAFITKSWLRTSTMLKVETIAKHFKIFWSLQVRTCVYMRIGRYALG